jgi:hypothetical protein
MQENLKKAIGMLELMAEDNAEAKEILGHINLFREAFAASAKRDLDRNTKENRAYSEQIIKFLRSRA